MNESLPFMFPARLIKELISFEGGVKYDELPTKGEQPFTIINGKGSVLLSAPHGARSFRNNKKEVWHEEDEYTAGLAFILHKITCVHTIATINKIDKYDPNFTKENEYKYALRRLCMENGIKFVIDLHGASIKSGNLARKQLVDIGVGGRPPVTIHAHTFGKVTEILESHLGKGSTDRDGKPGFDAALIGTTITSFCFGLGLRAIQLEMKPQLRIAKRLETATLYKSDGDYEGEKGLIVEMIHALVEIILFLDSPINHGLVYG